MPRAVVLGGTGLVGRAIAQRLSALGWRVDVTGRDPANMPAELADAGVTFVRAESRDPAQVAAAFGGGADLLVDCICFTAKHAQRLLPLARNAASTVMISSKAVYVDAAGNHSNSDVEPRFDGPIRRDAADHGSRRTSPTARGRATARTRSRPSGCCSRAACR